MPVDRALFEASHSESTVPDWHCPICRAGYLRIRPGSFHSGELRESWRCHGEEWFDHDHVKKRYSALLECNNEKCKEPVVLSGRGGVEMVPNEDLSDYEYVDIFWPEYISPSPLLVQIPKDCPNEVLEKLGKAFVASWGDPLAASNHVRSAVECLLDALKEPKTRMSKGRRTRIPLHTRIVSLGSRNKEFSEELLAVKWLGNQGSHNEELTRDDVFDAFDILERVLKDIFDKKERKRVKAMVKTINKKRGSARAKRRKGSRFLLF